MKYYYDFHIHSALSPCAENEMTPNNIVNMAKVNGLDVIAVTDHNSCANLRAVSKCAEDKSVVFVPGIEVESVEEVHICCLFEDLGSAAKMSEIVREHLKKVRNKESIFGEQLIMNEKDQVIGKEELLLLTSTDLSVDEVFEYAEKLGGTAYFAHVDRESYSVLSVLGTFPKEIDISLAEVSNCERGREFIAGRKELAGKTIVISSDAHRLADISRRENFIEIGPGCRADDRIKITASDIVKWLKDHSRRR